MAAKKVSVNRCTNANIYLEGNTLLGKAEEVSLPDVKYKAAEHKALGMVGVMEFTTGLDKMEMKIKWNSFYPDVMSDLGNPYDTVRIQVRANIETWDSSGKTADTALIAYLTVSPANFPGGNFKQHDNVELETTCKVYAFKLEIGGVVVLEVDVMNNTHKINGVDLLAEYRKNIGA